MKHHILLYLVVTLFIQACITNPSNQAQGLIGGVCDGCELMYQDMPEILMSSDTTIGWREEGEKLVVKGKVFHRKDNAPAPGITLYFWQTGADGLYRPLTSQVGSGRRHGRLRAWVKTDADGNYSLYTIFPAPYPGRDIPSHIHIAVLEPGLNEYYIDDIEFESDSLLTPELRASRKDRGGTGIGVLKKVNGIFQIRRDIYLGKNIPNYNR